MKMETKIVMDITLSNETSAAIEREVLAHFVGKFPQLNPTEFETTYASISLEYDPVWAHGSTSIKVRRSYQGNFEVTKINPVD